MRTLKQPETTKKHSLEVYHTYGDQYQTPTHLELR